MQNEGIREQKRRETKQRIRDEAARLVEERGYDNVTVDDICRDAGISRRTFFNYVDSKDEAILGSFPFAFSDESLTAIKQTPSDNVLELVIRSIEVAPGGFDGPATACRRELLEKTPGSCRRRRPASAAFSPRWAARSTTTSSGSQTTGGTPVRSRTKRTSLSCSFKGL